MPRALLPLLLAALVVGVAGCGGEDDKQALPETVVGTTTTATTTEEPGASEGDPEAGKEVFSSAGCGSCHVLEDAGASGAVGPSLDDAKPDYELVVDRVTNGKGAMPSFSDELSEEQINDVAAYVVEATSG